MLASFPEALNFNRLTLKPFVCFMETRMLGLTKP